jgi:hypothetical protein
MKEAEEATDGGELSPDGSTGETPTKTPPHEAPKAQAIHLFPLPIRSPQILREEVPEVVQIPAVGRHGVGREIPFVGKNLEDLPGLFVRAA